MCPRVPLPCRYDEPSPEVLAVNEPTGLRGSAGPSPADEDRVVIGCGADVETGAFVLGRSSPRGTGQMASQSLLREIAGVAQWPRSSSAATGPGSHGSPAAGDGCCVGGYNPQDWGRKFLTNGGCVYIDLNHLELCTAEVRSAWDFVAAWHAMLRVARQAQDAANRRLPPGQHIQDAQQIQ